MYKKAIITILLALVAMAGQAQTPKDSSSIPKDSLCQERIAKSDTINCPLDKLFLLKANVTNKEESKRNLPKIALPKNDIYREKFIKAVRIMENPTLPTNWLAATSWGLRVIPFLIFLYREQINVEPSNIQFPMST